MMNFKASIQAVDYIIRHTSDNDILDKFTILKLLFFAERYSLRKYSQSITNDNFVAMRCGPVASSTFDIISFKYSVTHKIKQYASKVIDKIPPHFVRSYGLLGARDDYDELSDSDIESLDFSVEKFGIYSSKKTCVYYS